MRILAHAQELIYQLLDGMPSAYQRQSLKALLELFLKAQGAPLPEHSHVKSASALSRFLTVYSWSVRQVIRHVRQAIRQELKRYRPRGRRPHLQVILDMTTLEKRGKFKAFSDLISIIEAVLEEFGLKTSSFVSNRLPLLNLNPQIIEAVRSGEISPTSATLINRTPEQHQAALIEFSKTATKTQLKERIDQLKYVEQSQGIKPGDLVDNSGIIMPTTQPQRDDDNSRIIMTTVPVQERIYTRLKSIRRRKSLLNDQRVQEHLAQVDSVLEKIEAIAGEKGISLS